MRVGISRMNITPALGMSMAGFRERDHGAESIHDLLYATVMCLRMKLVSGQPLLLVI